MAGYETLPGENREIFIVSSRGDTMFVIRILISNLKPSQATAKIFCLSLKLFHFNPKLFCLSSLPLFGEDTEMLINDVCVSSLTGSAVVNNLENFCYPVAKFCPQHCKYCQTSPEISKFIIRLTADKKTVT